MNLPTEKIKLPSKGLVYPENNPLSNGEIEMKYLTAREEDILTNLNYAKDGTLYERLLKSIIVTPGVDPNDLVLGDRSALIIASRILGYGKDYKFSYYNKKSKQELSHTVDLTTLKEKQVDFSVYNKGKNEFEFNLPYTKNILTFKLLTSQDEKNIELEIKGMQKISPSSNPEITTRLKNMIISVNGKTEKEYIYNFVDNMLAADSRELRKYVNKISPDIELSFLPDNYGIGEDIIIPIGVNFLWPDLGE